MHLVNLLIKKIIKINQLSYWYTPSISKYSGLFQSIVALNQTRPSNRRAQFWILANQIANFEVTINPRNMYFKIISIFFWFWGYFSFVGNRPISKKSTIFWNGGSSKIFISGSKFVSPSMKAVVRTCACAISLDHLDFTLFMFGSQSYWKAGWILRLCEFSSSFGLQSWCTGSIL